MSIKPSHETWNGRNDLLQYEYGLPLTCLNLNSPQPPIAQSKLQLVPRRRRAFIPFKKVISQGTIVSWIH